MELDLWTQSLVTAMTALWTKVANFIPNLFGALVLVLLGFVVAKLLDTLLSKLLAKLGLDRLMAGTGLTKLLGRAGLQVPISTLIGKIVYWFVLLIFLVSAAQSLDLSEFQLRSTCWHCICRKCSAARWCCWWGFTRAIGQRAGARGRRRRGLGLRGGLGANRPGAGDHHQYFCRDQPVGGQTDLLNHVIVIVLITVGLAVALAMGLGSREIAGQILAGIYVRELYQVGQQVRVGEVEGQIEEIGTVKTTVLTDDGELVSLSNRILLEQQVSSR